MLNDGQVPGIGQAAGAVEALAIDPTNANIAYAGTVNGGVWKSTNATNANPTWAPLTDQQLPGLAINSVAISPVNSSVIYAGTGSVSAFAIIGSPGFGLARSSDGGTTWTVLAQSTFADQPIRSVVPTTLSGGQVVMAATLFRTGAGSDPVLPPLSPGGGLYRSNDGGVSFTRISGAPGSGLPDQGVSDLVADPSNPMRFYAAVPLPFGSATPTGMEGIYRSDDGGLTWTHADAGITDLATDGRILLAVHNSPGNDVLYAATVSSRPSPFSTVNVNGDFQGVFRSPNLGASWTAMGLPSQPVDTEAQVMLWHGAIAADPTDPNVVFLSGDASKTGRDGKEGNLFRGDASRQNPWQSVVGAGANGTAPHADSRAIVFEASGNLLQACDGGVFRLVTPDNPTSRIWTSVNGNLGTAEFHSIAYDPVSHVIFGGTQDNGTIAQTAPGSSSGGWFAGGDGGFVAVDANQTAHPGTSIRYSSAQNFSGFNRRSVDANNVAGSPVNIALKIVSGDGTGKHLFHFDPNIGFYQTFTLNTIDPRRMLIGTKNLYESFDQGDSLNDLGSVGDTVGTAWGESLVYGGRLNGVVDPDMIYVGASAHILHRVQMGDPLSTLTAYPGSKVISFAVDPQNYRQLYVMDDQTRIWASSDEGTSWTELTRNLPRLTPPTVGQAIEIYSTPSAPDAVLMAGGLTGVFEMPNPSSPGAKWSVLGDGLPHALVLDLHYDYTDNVLVAGTLGRGAWMLSNLFAAGADAPSMSIAGATVAAISSPAQGMDSFFAAFSAGTANLAAAADLLATALAFPLPTPTVVPTPAAMTPATAAALPSPPAGTDQVVTVPSPLSSTPTSGLAPRAANGLADDGGTDVLRPADPSWDGEAGPWSPG
jgi:hypothetical protein